MHVIKYDTPIEIYNEKVYNTLMHEFRGHIAGRKDEAGKFYIKLWTMAVRDILDNALIMLNKKPSE